MKQEKLVSPFYKSAQPDPLCFAKDVLIDYHTEFRFVEAGLNFHWWGNAPSTLHHHNYYEFIYIAEGSLVHILNKNKQVLPLGTLIMIKDNDSHMAYPVKNSDCLQLTLGVTKEQLKRLCDALSPDIYEAINQSSSRIITLTNSEQKNIMDLATQIDYVFDSTSNHSLEKILINQILLCFIFIIRKKHDIPSCPQWFTDLLQKMASPEYLCADVPQIARLAHYSPKTLVSYFKKYTGDTIVSYQNKLKVNYACRLLLISSKTTLEIANDLLYDSLTAFNCMFKKYTGMTPKEYRNTARQIQSRTYQKRRHKQKSEQKNRSDES